MRHRNYVCVFAEVMYDLVSAALAPPPRAREEPRRNRPRPRAARCYHEGGPTVVRRITRERETVELILSPDPTGYQSRHGLIDQPTLPMARLNMDANPVRDYPLSPPKPVVDLYRNSRRPAYPGGGIDRLVAGRDHALSAHLPIVIGTAVWAVFLCSRVGLGWPAFAAACLIVWLVERSDEVYRDAAERERSAEKHSRKKRRR